MRLLELFLNELADQPYAFQIAQHGAEKSTFGFDTNTGAEYIVRIVPFSIGGAFQNNALDVSFALRQDGRSIDSATGQAGTDALRIFGSVLEAVKQTIAKRTKQGLNIEYIQFKAVSKEPKRVALYQRFAKNIGRYLPGWEYWKNWSDDGISTSIVKRSNLNEDQSAQDAFDDAGMYRAVGPAEAKIILRQGRLLPSTDLMPFDWEVIEYGLGDAASDMDEDEIEAYVQSVVPWYNGSLQSVKNGVNLTSDWENARGYAGNNGVVFAVNCHGDVAQFSDSHYFAQNANECIPVAGMYDSIEYSLEDLKKIFNGQTNPQEKNNEPKITTTSQQPGRSTNTANAQGNQN